MKKQPTQFFIWTILVTFIFLSITPAFNLLPTMVGQTFEESPDYQYEKDKFYNYLEASILNPIDWKKVEKNLTVSVDEIDQHRYRYGSLSEQVESIMDQYADRLYNAERSNNEKLVDSLLKERDEKIQDIEKNFEDTEHVRQKVLEEKLEAIKDHVASNEPDPAFLTDLYSYHLTNIKTGEVFTQGNVDEWDFETEYFDENGYLMASQKKYLANIMDPASGDSVVWLDEFEVDLNEIAGEKKQFEGTVAISDEAFKGSHLERLQKEFYWNKYRNYSLWVIALVALLIVCTKLKFNKNWVYDLPMIARYQQVKIDFQLGFLLFGTLVAVVFQESVTFLLYYAPQDTYPLHAPIQFTLFTMLIFCLITQSLLLVDRWKQGGKFAEDLKQSYMTQFLRACQDLFLNRSIGFQAFILLIGFFLAGFGLALSFSFIIGGFGIGGFMLFLYALIAIFFGLPAIFIFVTRAAYLNRVFKATEQMAAGTLHAPIKVKGKSPIAKHAEQLNKLREGVRVSMTAQAKSERLKTELITNVSHDLRTPLTSIITYTDLLKTKDLSEEDRLKYVTVVDQKAERLKTLIEDLFEVSKMASGNMTLTKQKVDLAQLLRQSLAEHEDRITDSSLDFRVQLPETPIYAEVDGQKWWRVLDNLIVNAVKYSMKHTRVYIQLTEEEGRALFTIKNISEYPLNENSDELFERFKRGDDSRHTEGSGLGLAIAQSIVDLHGGEMQLDIDGDLFKVTIEIHSRR